MSNMYWEGQLEGCDVLFDIGETPEYETWYATVGVFDIELPPWVAENKDCKQAVIIAYGKDGLFLDLNNDQKEAVGAEIDPKGFRNLWVRLHDINENGWLNK